MGTGTTERFYMLNQNVPAANTDICSMVTPPYGITEFSLGSVLLRGPKCGAHIWRKVFYFTFERCSWKEPSCSIRCEVSRGVAYILSRCGGEDPNAELDFKVRQETRYAVYETLLKHEVNTSTHRNQQQKHHIHQREEQTVIQWTSTESSHRQSNKVSH